MCCLSLIAPRSVGLQRHPAQDRPGVSAVSARWLVARVTRMQGAQGHPPGLRDHLPPARGGASRGHREPRPDELPGARGEGRGAARGGLVPDGYIVCAHTRSCADAPRPPHGPCGIGGGSRCNRRLVRGTHARTSGTRRLGACAAGSAGSEQPCGTWCTRPNRLPASRGGLGAAPCGSAGRRAEPCRATVCPCAVWASRVRRRGEAGREWGRAGTRRGRGGESAAHLRRAGVYSPPRDALYVRPARPCSASPGPWMRPSRMP